MSAAFNWKQCFDQISPKLVLYARQLTSSAADADDVVQMAFVRWWRRFPDGDTENVPLLYAAVRTIRDPLAIPAVLEAAVVGALSEVLGCPVAFAKDCVGPDAAAAVAAMKAGDVLLLENVRFYPGEEANDPAFARALAENGDLYVNDAFSAAHRAHASTEGLGHVLQERIARLTEAEQARMADVKAEAKALCRATEYRVWAERPLPPLLLECVAARRRLLAHARGACVRSR